MMQACEIVLDRPEEMGHSMQLVQRGCEGSIIRKRRRKGRTKEGDDWFRGGRIHQDGDIGGRRIISSPRWLRIRL
jgi:hypothetical protein